jgi:hypothetical protein
MQKMFHYISSFESLEVLLKHVSPKNSNTIIINKNVV